MLRRGMVIGAMMRGGGVMRGLLLLHCDMAGVAARVLFLGLHLARLVLGLGRSERRDRLRGLVALLARCVRLLCLGSAGRGCGRVPCQLAERGRHQRHEAREQPGLHLRLPRSPVVAWRLQRLRAVEEVERAQQPMQRLALPVVRGFLFAATALGGRLCLGLVPFHLCSHAAMLERRVLGPTGSGRGDDAPAL